MKNQKNKKLIRQIAQLNTLLKKKGEWGKLKSGAGWIMLKYTERK